MDTQKQVLRVPPGCEFVSCHCTFWYVDKKEVETDKYCSQCGGSYRALKPYELDYYNVELRHLTYEEIGLKPPKSPPAEKKLSRRKPIKRNS